MNDTLLNALTAEQREIILGLTTPALIQAFLDSIPYAPEYTNRCPLRVMQDRRAHCLDGALFAAAVMRQIGFPPRVLAMFPEPGMDDDNLVAMYRINGAYGAVAQSNFVGLRFREAVYRSLRELVLSYFEGFYNVDKIKTLRNYTAPCNLASFDRLNWTISDAGADAIERALPSLRRYPVLTSEMPARLSKVDDLTYQAGLLGADDAGLYRPKA